MPVYAEPGYLLFQREGALLTQQFNPKKSELIGEPVRIADEIPFNASNGRAAFAASRNGILIYRSGTGAGGSQFVWVDRTGKQLRTAGEPAAYNTTFSLSPDGKQIAVPRREGGTTSSQDIWVIDWERNVSTRVTFAPSSHADPVWSFDGLRIAFDARPKGTTDILEKKASGTGEELPLLDSPSTEYLDDWSKDGRYIIYHVGDPTNDVYALPLFGERKSFPIVQSPYNKDEAHLSSDGKWLAYNSNESGVWQVYVVSFPMADQKIQISTNGGAQPRWRSDGKELFYHALDGKLMAADIKVGTKMESSVPHVLFDTGLVVDPTRDQYAVTSDGQQFLLLKPVTEATPTPITAVVNWTASIRK